MPGTIVGTLGVSDPDSGDTFTFEIAGGTGLGVFSVNNNKLEVANAAILDFETTPSYSLDIKVTDSGGLSLTQSFTINLLDLNEGGVILGTPSDDQLAGTENDDEIDGLAGDDQINAGGGNDKLIGGAGRDLLNGGAGIDTADYSGSSSGVFITLTTFFLSPYGLGFGGEATGDRLLDIENIAGSNFGDTLIGNGEQNTLDGAGGNDYLIGRGGTDQFIFKQAYGTDTILDFRAANGEKIIIDYDGFEDFSDLANIINPIGFLGSSTRIDFGSGDRLTLLGVRAQNLDEDNFEFL